MPGDVTLWPSLTGGETIDLLARMRGGIDEGRRAELIERFDLDPHKKARTYSKGNRQKVSLISAFSSRARLLLLDEPSSGLDPLMENVFQQCVGEARDRGTTVLLSSHILAETEALCERVTIIRAGKTVESGSLESMRHLSRTSIKAEMIGDPGDLRRIKGVEDVSIDGNTLRAQVDSESLGELIRALGDAGVRSLVSQPPTLEELFLRHYDTTDRGLSMSTATLDRPRHPAHPAPRAGSNFSGTLGMLRLYLRRDRVSLPLWVLLLSVPLASVYVGSVLKVYPTETARAGFAASIMASPAQRALYGQVYNDSIGAVGIWKAGMFHLLIAVAVILTVIRHTRADEETGRTELVDSTAVGRYAEPQRGAAVVVRGVDRHRRDRRGGIAHHRHPAGRVARLRGGAGHAPAWSSPRSPRWPRSCRRAPGSPAAPRSPCWRTAFTLRAVGDAGDGTLSWLSPLGWSLQVRPYAGDRWWVLLLHLVTTAALTLVAYRLLAGRDVGAGLIAERAGPGGAGPRLRGVDGLTWRLDRGALLLWTVGLCLYGLLMGSVVHGIGDELGDSTIARDIVARMGGTSALEEAFIAVAFAMMGMVAGAFAISLTLRLHQEESGQRAETTLAGAVSRTHWLASHLAAALVGSAVAMLASGVTGGLVYGIAAGDVGGKLAVVVGTAAVQLPAVWLLAAVTVALFGLAPRFTPVAWGVLVGFIAVYLIGSLARFPQWVQDLEPFAHTPRVGADFTAAPLLWLLAIDAALIILGAMAFRRRDLRC